MATAVRSSPLLTVAEAADLLRVSQRTLRRLIESGQVSSTRVGSSIRIHRDALSGWLESEESP